MNIDLLLKLIDAPEDEIHDFKRQWYQSEEDKIDLAKDILSFLNTTHHEDCYIIIGIDDNTKQIVGVENDENRKTLQQLTDLLLSWDLANLSIPNIKLETYSINNHEIDVIIIPNTANTPYYFKKEYTRGKKRITPGQIFTRINENNTGLETTAPHNQVKQLWLKNLGVDLSIQNRFKKRVEEHDKWSFVSTNDSRGLVFNYNPDFFIQMKDYDDLSAHKIYSFSVGLTNTVVSRTNIELKFGNLTIDNFILKYLDNANGFLVHPDDSFIRLNKGDTPLAYYSYTLDNMNYLLTRLLLKSETFHPGIEKFYVFKDALETIVVYSTNEKKEYIEGLISQKLREEPKELNKIINVHPQDLKKYTNSIKLDSSNANEQTEVYVKSLIRERNLGKYIKEFIINSHKQRS